VPLDNPETVKGEITLKVVLHKDIDEQVVGVIPDPTALKIQYSTPGAMSQVTTTLLSLATTTTLFGAGAEDPPLPKQPCRSRVAAATMMNVKDLFISR
jgi:hypothetical protein